MLDDSDSKDDLPCDPVEKMPLSSALIFFENSRSIIVPKAPGQGTAAPSTGGGKVAARSPLKITCAPLWSPLTPAVAWPW